MRIYVCMCVYIYIYIYYYYYRYYIYIYIYGLFLRVDSGVCRSPPRKHIHRSRVCQSTTRSDAPRGDPGLFICMYCYDNFPHHAF